MVLKSCSERGEKGVRLLIFTDFPPMVSKDIPNIHRSEIPSPDLDGSTLSQQPEWCPDQPLSNSNLPSLSVKSLRR